MYTKRNEFPSDSPRPAPRDFQDAFISASAPRELGKLESAGGFSIRIDVLVIDKHLP